MNDFRNGQGKLNHDEFSLTNTRQTFKGIRSGLGPLKSALVLVEQKQA